MESPLVEKEQYNLPTDFFFANIGQCFAHVLLLILGNTHGESDLISLDSLSYSPQLLSYFHKDHVSA